MDDFNSKMDKQFLKTGEQLDDSADRILNAFRKELNMQNELMEKSKKKNKKLMLFILVVSVLLSILASFNYLK